MITAWYHHKKHAKKSVNAGQFDRFVRLFLQRARTCSKSKLTRPWYRADDTDERNEMARKAFEAVLTVTLRKPDNPEYKKFSDDVKARARREYNETIGGDEEVFLLLLLFLNYRPKYRPQSQGAPRRNVRMGQIRGIFDTRQQVSNESQTISRYDYANWTVMT